MLASFVRDVDHDMFLHEMVVGWCAHACTCSASDIYWYNRGDCWQHMLEVMCGLLRPGLPTKLCAPIHERQLHHQLTQVDKLLQQIWKSLRN